MVGQAPNAIKLLNDDCVLWKLLQGRAIMQWPLASGKEGQVGRCIRCPQDWKQLQKQGLSAGWRRSSCPLPESSVLSESK